MGTRFLDTSGGGYALAYREARRGLEDQEQLVMELRARAGALIASAAVTTSFFGSEALGKQAVGVAGWVAIACFVLLGFAVLAVLWPRRDWEFSPAPAELISTYLEPTDGGPLARHLIERDLALHMGHSADLNRGHLRSSTTAFRIGALLLVAEVLAWVLALATRG